MEKPSDIISTLEVGKKHCGNFPSMTPREVIDEGVLKAALGYASGSTVQSILRSHGLLLMPKNDGSFAGLTRKGVRYLRAVYGLHIRDIFAMREKT